MLLSTAFRICFIGWPVMFWNCLARSYLFTSRILYHLLFSFICGMGEHESFTMMRNALIFDKVPHIVVENTSLANIECWLMWDTNNKFITILTVLGH